MMRGAALSSGARTETVALFCLLLRPPLEMVLLDHQLLRYLLKDPMLKDLLPCCSSPADEELLPRRICWMRQGTWLE